MGITDGIEFQERWSVITFSRGSMKLSELPKQQRRVVELIAEGKQQREIAESMNLSRRSVNNYIEIIAEKTGAHGRMAILRHFYKLEPRK